MDNLNEKLDCFNSSESSSGDNEASEFVFEVQWEEDDMVALSGNPGHSFQKVLTGTAQVDIYDPGKRKVQAKPSIASDLTSSCHSRESEPENLSTNEELKSSDEISQSTLTSHPSNADIELEWDNDTPVHPEGDETPPTAYNASIWRTVKIGDKNYKLDLSAITPYRQVLSHGGYYGEGLNAIVVFSACYLPNANESNYEYIMDNLFLHIISTLELLVAEEYIIIFFNSGCSRRNFPTFRWLKKCYGMVHHRLRKNLEHLVIVHPTWYTRMFFTFFRPFMSSKFSRKLKFVPTLHRLADIVALESVMIPDVVQEHDIKLQALVKTHGDTPVALD